MENFKELYRNGHQIKNNINHFATLYETEYEEGTQHGTKPNTPSIVLSKNKKGR